MSETKSSVPKLSPLSLSGYIADLFLAGVGEEEAINHKTTRQAWHLFFFSLVLFLLVHILIRIALIPSFSNVESLAPRIRLLESCIYGYLLIVLVFLIYNHYHVILLPRRNPRLVTIGFFFAVMTLLFSRLYYSLFHFNDNLFRWTDRAILPTGDFGIRGLRDLGAATEFVIFSGCAMLNCSYSEFKAGSLLIASLEMFQSIVQLDIHCNSYRYSRRNKYFNKHW